MKGLIASSSGWLCICIEGCWQIRFICEDCCGHDRFLQGNITVFAFVKKWYDKSWCESDWNYYGEWACLLVCAKDCVAWINCSMNLFTYAMIAMWTTVMTLNSCAVWIERIQLKTLRGTILMTRVQTMPILLLCLRKSLMTFMILIEYQKWTKNVNLNKTMIALVAACLKRFGSTMQMTNNPPSYKLENQLCPCTVPWNTALFQKQDKICWWKELQFQQCAVLQRDFRKCHSNQSAMCMIMIFIAYQRFARLTQSSTIFQVLIEESAPSDYY